MKDDDIYSLREALGVKVLKGFAYPRSELLRVWKLLLLNQFHDVLPGSSIGKVYADAMAYYEGQ